MLTDPISDYLTRVRNALAADHTDVEVPASRLKKELSRILTEQGYITSYEVEPTAVGEVIRIQLKYTEDRRPVISGMDRISRPGRRNGWQFARTSWPATSPTPIHRTMPPRTSNPSKA